MQSNEERGGGEGASEKPEDLNLSVTSIGIGKQRHSTKRNSKKLKGNHVFNIDDLKIKKPGAAATIVSIPISQTLINTLNPGGGHSLPAQQPVGGILS